MIKITTNSEQETLDWAKNFAKSLQGSEVIGLSGDLGAGKTVFAKGLAAGLNIKKVVNSPTFVIMKVYSITNEKSRIKNLVHIDAYRLSSADDIKAIGADEYFKRKETVTVIEWPENIKEILPQGTISVKIDSKDNQRIIIIN